MAAKDTLYVCSKRKLGTTATSYCDWAEKKKPTLIKKACKNCKFFTDEVYVKEKEVKVPKDNKEKD